MTEDFNKWWDSEGIAEDNSYREGSPVFWAWEGWQAGVKAERKPLMTDEEYEQAMADEGQRRMLEIDTEVRAMIKEAVDAEREACAKVAYDYTVKVSLPNFFESAEYVAAAIRARGQG
jgi:hypothetical protein